MAQWQSDPKWNDLESINGGFNFNSFLDISASDFNKLVENMQFLYKNRNKGGINMDEIYPVGSIYMTLDPTFNPAEHFSGAWSRLKDRFLLGAGEYSDEHGSKGGEATHKLTTNEMPAHNHEQTTTSEAGGWSFPQISLLGNSTYGNDLISDSGFVSDTGTKTSELSIKGRYVITKNSGGGAEHNNMPPYLAVYMWQRTA